MMAVENLSSENTQTENIEALTSQREEEAKTLWNGRMVNKGAPKIGTTNTPFTRSISSLQKGLNSSSFTIKNASLGNQEIEVSLCGEKVDVDVSASVSANTDGDKSASVDVSVSDKEQSFSGSVSGSVSQDSSGNTSGEITGTVTKSF